MSEKNKKASWVKDAQYRIKNRKWLQYSSNIARRIIAAMKTQGIQQNQLAEKIQVRPQYISRIVKGQENLSLATIAKIAEALNQELISFPEYALSNKKKKVVSSTSISSSYVILTKLAIGNSYPVRENALHISYDENSLISNQAMKRMEELATEKKYRDSERFLVQESNAFPLSYRVQNALPLSTNQI